MRAKKDNAGKNVFVYACIYSYYIEKYMLMRNIALKYKINN